MAASCRQLQVEVLLDRLLHELVDHLRCVRLVLDMLRQHELRLKQSKCAQVCVRCTHSVIPRTHGVHRRHGDGQPEGPGGGGLDAPALSSGIARLPRPRRANTAMFICKYYLGSKIFMLKSNLYLILKGGYLFQPSWLFCKKVLKYVLRICLDNFAIPKLY